MKIINIGFIPPPYGGVAVHLERLSQFLCKNSLDTLLIDTSGTRKIKKNVKNMNEFRMFLYLIFKEKRSIVHFHIFSKKLVILFFLLSWKHITILSFHNEIFLNLLKSGGVILYKILSYMLNNLDRIIVDNEKCRGFAREFISNNDKIKVIPEFIPPVDIPELELKNILKIRETHKFILSSNASKITFYEGEDTYGIDLLIEMTDKIVNEMKFDAVLIFLLPNIGDHNYFEKMQGMIKQHNLSSRFIFITEPIQESSSLWSISDLVIRSTNTDGNPLSIAEAQSLGVPVLASDCIERPTNTILFKTRDLGDLVNKVAGILSDLNFYRDKIICEKSKDYSNDFLNLYTKLIKKSN
jgi:glycosyltransferase involved in cell wall biosynthesis